MANLKFSEKQLFEKLFDRSGYVLNFSDRTFKEFFRDFNINIEDNKYNEIFMAHLFSVFVVVHIVYRF